jgi:hypothetical protein
VKESRVDAEALLWRSFERGAKRQNMDDHGVSTEITKPIR